MNKIIAGILLTWCIFLIGCEKECSVVENIKTVVVNKGITTLDATNVGLFKATLQGRYDFPLPDSIDYTLGFQLSVDSLFTTGKTNLFIADNISQDSTFSYSITRSIGNNMDKPELEPGTKYYYRSFIIMDDKSFTGGLKTFNTVPVELTAGDFDSIYNSIKCKVNLFTDGYLVDGTLGVCYGTTPDPTIEDYTVSINDQDVSIKEDGTYAVIIEQPIYGGILYYRAFYSYNGKTYYGKTQTSSSWLSDTNIELSRTAKNMIVGQSSTLTAKIFYKSEIVNNPYTWSTDNPDVVTVNESGQIKALNVGVANVTLTMQSLTASCRIKVVSSESDITHNYVDLGLSVNWATFNVGATDPEDYGGYYSWGEIDTKDGDYYWTTYTYGTTTAWKYYDNYNSRTGVHDTDGNNTLEPEDDVAYIMWGDKWRMPTSAEFDELINNCEWEKTDLNGTIGIIVKSKIPGYTDRSIFLPASGGKGYSDYSRTYYNNYIGASGHYWSSSLNKEPGSQCANFLSFYETSYIESDFRCLGFPIRPVCPSDDWLSKASISIISDSALLIPGGKTVLTATVNCNGVIPVDQITWSSDNPDVATVQYGVVTAKQPGTATITAAVQSVTSQFVITVMAESEIEHDYVDLGLSVKWATLNVGSLNPRHNICTFAWGETDYKWNNYEFQSSYYKWYGYDDGYYKLTKYNFYSNNGIIDNKYQLELEDDVAHVKWGGDWRMPTDEEFQELIKNCTIEADGGCIKVTSNIEGYTDHYIYLPLDYVHKDFSSWNGKTGYYWSNTLLCHGDYLYWNGYNYDSNYAARYDIKLNSFPILSRNPGYRCDGVAVRPVCP